MATQTIVPQVVIPESLEKGVQLLEYTLDEKLGEGGFALVWKARQGERGDFVAIKVSSGRRPEDKAAAIRNLRMESENLCSLDHENIVKWLLYAEDLPQAMLVLELANIDLHTYIHKTNSSNGLAEEVASAMFRQVLFAVDHCHKKNLAHRDIKPENILLQGLHQPIIKLADFGLARVMENGGFTDRCGTIPYMALEVLIACSDQPYGLEADPWSCGVVLHHMLTGEHPFETPNHARDLTPNAIDYIQDQMTEYQPPCEPLL